MKPIFFYTKKIVDLLYRKESIVININTAFKNYFMYIVTNNF